MKLNGATVRKVWRIRGYSGGILTGSGLVQLESNVPTEPGIYLLARIACPNAAMGRLVRLKSLGDQTAKLSSLEQIASCPDHYS